MAVKGADAKLTPASGDAGDVGAVEAGAGQRRSWVDGLIAAIERSPLSPWVTYAVLIVAAVLLAHAHVWVSGQPPNGGLDVVVTYYAVLTVAPLWLIHYLNRVGGASLETFRPALAPDEPRLDEWRRELTSIPARPALALAGVAVALTLFGYAIDPVATRVAGLPPATVALRACAEGLIGALILVLLFHALRQLHAVSRIHAAATRIDLLRPAPLYAFSRLTARTAVGILLMVYPSLFLEPGAWTGGDDEALFVPWHVVPTIVAIAAFVLPLRGMHGRIAAEKVRLQEACAVRIEAVTGDIHAAVDAGDLARAGGLNPMLTSLVTERELLDKLPTWPWRPGTLGGFVTAMVLPLALILISRIIDEAL